MGDAAISRHDSFYDNYTATSNGNADGASHTTRRRPLQSPFLQQDPTFLEFLEFF
jgi:hypothetical protein